MTEPPCGRIVTAREPRQIERKRRTRPRRTVFRLTDQETEIILRALAGMYLSGDILYSKDEIWTVINLVRCTKSAENIVGE